jgi:hypothetical protein
MEAVGIIFYYKDLEVLILHVKMESVVNSGHQIDHAASRCS